MNHELEEAIVALRRWQAEQDQQGAKRHGRCLEAVRYALGTVGLRLPPKQSRPNNTALWNGHEMLADPQKYGWRRVKPSADRLTLAYFDHVGQLPDGRIAGHIGIVDEQLLMIYSSVDYPLSSGWKSVRIGSFLPDAGIESLSDETPLEGQQEEPSQGQPPEAILGGLDSFIAPQPGDEDKSQ